MGLRPNNTPIPHTRALPFPPSPCWSLCPALPSWHDNAAHDHYDDADDVFTPPSHSTPWCRRQNLGRLFHIPRCLYRIHNALVKIVLILEIHDGFPEFTKIVTAWRMSQILITWGHKIDMILRIVQICFNLILWQQFRIFHSTWTPPRPGGNNNVHKI